ncbi:MAG: polysaccharide lyase family protein [Thermogutta sp.]
MAIFRSLGIALGILFGLNAFYVCPQSLGEGPDGTPPQVLWQIGEADKSPQGFALAPDGYASFRHDAVFIVGVSKPEKDWTYVQPGPLDVWAGSQVHQSTIVFGLESTPREPCELVVLLANTHGRVPPRIRITVNGKSIYDQALPRGGPDATIRGDLSEAKPFEMRATISPDGLQAGQNVVVISSLEGSWIIYDAVIFLAPEDARISAVRDVTIVKRCDALPALIRRGAGLHQVVEMTILRAGDEMEASITEEDSVYWSGRILPGENEILIPIPRVSQPRIATLSLKLGEKIVWSQKVELTPVREWNVYLLPHSHVDIGYTQLQTEVERDHWRYYEEALASWAATADFPPEVRFKWNVEVLWAVDSYLRQAPPEKREAFIQGVRDGAIGLQALYGNELTGLCRPEELLRLLEYSERLEETYHFTIDSAMISDVPGYTWGIVTALAHAGVKYFSIGPNGGHRIGQTLRAWGDKAFWWIAPDGKNRVLCWIPRRGYWRGFRGKEELMAYLKGLESENYPFDMVQIRHCLGDNSGPDTAISEFAKKWNETYAFPKIIIATSSEMMRSFAAKYGDTLPEVRGDFTPYWEDGAASSALETGLVRHAAERLSSAETLWAILRPSPYPDDKFYEAWRNVILYDEHTWGAYNSISEPDSQFAQSQWAIKRQFALDAARQSEELLAASVSGFDHGKVNPQRFLMVFNPCGWQRTDLVFVAPVDQPTVVIDSNGRIVPSQRLSTGELVFLAEAVPAFGARRYELKPQSATGVGIPEPPTIGENVLMRSAQYELEIDAATGNIRRLYDRKQDREIIAPGGEFAGAEFLYVPGRDPNAVQRVTAKPTVNWLDKGPLVQRVLVDGAAPGSRNLRRIYELADGLDYVRIEFIIDKEKVRTPEAVHLAFPFSVPEGEVNLGLAWAFINPLRDQLPGACKNYLTVQHWADISNEQFGATWVSLEAPLIELGKIRMDVPKPFDPDAWLTELEPTQTILSYVMNNYWETNYKADQEGPTTFVYFVQSHAGPFDAASSARFGISQSRPLLAVFCDEQAPVEIPSLVSLGSRNVLPVECKPTRDGAGFILRLLNLGSETEEVGLSFNDQAKPKQIWKTDLSESKKERIDQKIVIEAHELVSLRLE